MIAAAAALALSAASPAVGATAPLHVASVPAAFFEGGGAGSDVEATEAVAYRVGGAAAGAALGALPGLGWVASHAVCPVNPLRSEEALGYGIAGVGAVALGVVGYFLGEAAAAGNVSPSGVWAFLALGGGALVADIAVSVWALTPGRCAR